MSGMDINALLLTVKLAALTSIILIGISVPLAWWLAHWRSPAKSIVLAILALPLVLPPTVLGFYLLISFAPDTWLGQSWLALSGRQLAFSFEGILLGSVIYSLPFAVQPLHNAFEQLNPRFVEVAKTLGLNRTQQFMQVILPITRGSFFTAAGLSFAHTLGEFGVVLMIGGNIPGETQVVSIALFDHVEAMAYEQAHALALVMLLFSLCLLTVLYRFNSSRISLWK
ncbi:molybdate ABC transporter permease subunit [Aestuariibacter salexigens]|uniref:molybdate ABC transporter permease subunit n=1 Tax=Aestuariibacter salexigens TaxID=226010 RepID=UPI00040FB3FA|nr:molybdate ABC transporter permease subunit [Aestuariibacter salexigens]